MRLLLTCFVLAMVSASANAQWTDAGWVGTKINSSTGGYVINTTAPGVTAVAPSGGSSHNFIYEQYQDAMSANGQTYSITIQWTYTLYGSVNVSGSASSYCTWGNGTRSDAISTSGSYTDGPTQETGQDTVVNAPGASVTVSLNCDAQSAIGPPGASSTASSTLNGAYTP